MPKRRKKPFVPVEPSPGEVAGTPGPAPTREIDVLAGIAALICIGFFFLSAGALNPDGVSYLDLATAIQHGDWSHFVQGYWSPLLPFLTGVTAYVTGLTGPQLITVIHVLNLEAALAGLLIICLWARRTTATYFARAAIAAYMLCSAGLPRIEAVTPDVLLLAIAVWLSYEFLAHRSRRWLVVGVLLGLAFLAKTSSWPWLLVALPIRLWAADSAPARRQVWWSTLVCGALMLTWAVPMSIKYGHPTLGSSGRLNYSWYIAANSSRMPDTDRGMNTAYQAVPVGNGRAVTVATFDDAAHWTYQPWGDPTAWESKVLTQTGHPPSAVQLLSYWGRLTLRILVLWLAPLIVAVIIPTAILLRRRGMARELVTSSRDSFVVILLGLAGLAQFAAVHAEPRLIAPFSAMLALGVIHWCGATPAEQIRVKSAPLRFGMAWLGTAAALGFAAFRLNEGASSYTRLHQVARELDNLRSRLISAGQSNVQLAIVGPAAPVLASAYWIGARIVMQIPPAYADLIATLPPDQQSQMLLSVFSGKVPLIWQTTTSGGMRMLLVPQRQ